MENFISDDFILQTKSAKRLFHNHAENLPIIDYHCHLSPQDIANDRQFNSITEAWLEGDHYKWRAMRTNGVDESFITGKKDDFLKFQKWAETVPQTIRNPLFHWTHLELKRYFGVDTLLNPQTAQGIYNDTSAKLQSKEYSVRNLMLKMNVEAVCTTDDPIDTLEHHKKIAADGFKVKVLPAWRPDKAMAVEDPGSFNEYIDKLAIAANLEISTFDNLLDALRVRHDYFHENGCRLSDHGLETFFAADYTENEIRIIFTKIREGKNLGAEDILKFKSAMLYHFAILDQEKNWVQQFHIGALRNNNSRMMRILGPDTGFDSISDLPVAQSMSKFMNRLDTDDRLAKTILYNLNPSDNEVYATMLGNFQGSGIPGKIQWGSAWWFLDQKTGMEKHIEALSALGLLSRFVGMLTDSRSLLSYPRHEYFRRILCNILGNDMEKGEIPADFELVGKMVENISYHNAANYFKL
ncbi:MAG: glucuronate isomerase [Bacteroidales bacterium]|nr:glucuronate isomerase [Bacteroidales bacterium]